VLAASPRVVSWIARGAGAAGVRRGGPTTASSTTVALAALEPSDLAAVALARGADDGAKGLGWLVW
jgi:hypothetical protein